LAGNDRVELPNESSTVPSRDTNQWYHPFDHTTAIINGSPNILVSATMEPNANEREIDLGFIFPRRYNREYTQPMTGQNPVPIGTYHILMCKPALEVAAEDPFSMHTAFYCRCGSPQPAEFYKEDLDQIHRVRGIRYQINEVIHWGPQFRQHALMFGPLETAFRGRDLDTECEVVREALNRMNIRDHLHIAAAMPGSFTLPATVVRDI